MYLCMDSCGLLYATEKGDKEEECIFRESITTNFHNTYSSVKYSNSNRTMYLAINKRGQPRKLIIDVSVGLRNLSSYANAITMKPPGLHPHIRHESRHCKPASSEVLVSKTSNDRCPVGNKKKKKKKKKRKCTRENPCVKKNNKLNGGKKTNKKCGGDDSSGEKCQRVTNVNKSVGAKKKLNQKKLLGGNKQNANGKNKKKNFKGKLFQNGKKKGNKRTTTTTEVLVISTTTEDPMDDDYYGFENSTHFDWEDNSTASIDESSTTTIHPD